MLKCIQYRTWYRHNTTYNAQRYAEYFFYAIKINFFLASNNFHIGFWKPSLPAVGQFHVHPFAHGIQDSDLGSGVQHEQVFCRAAVRGTLDRGDSPCNYGVSGAYILIILHTRKGKTQRTEQQGGDSAKEAGLAARRGGAKREEQRQPQRRGQQRQEENRPYVPGENAG